MDIPSSIPTSFVPRSSSGDTRKYRAEFGGAYMFLGYGALFIVLLLAGGVFMYDTYLHSKNTELSEKLKKAQESIDINTVKDFVRLRDRLDAGQVLLNEHTSLAGFFSDLESILPSTVRFSSLHLTVDSVQKATMQGSGVAKNFNALAATSKAFAENGKIKGAIFSSIVINRDNSVGFAISADLDPELVTFSI